jgi:hypothetical protein
MWHLEGVVKMLSYLKQACTNIKQACPVHSSGFVHTQYWQTKKRVVAKAQVGFHVSKKIRG